MQSLKLGKTILSKKEAMTITGGLLIVLGMVGGYLVHPTSRILMGVGILIVLISAFTKKQIKKCSKCGEEILETAKKCKHCGAKVKKSLIRQFHDLMLLVLSIVIVGFMLVTVFTDILDGEVNNINIEQLKNTAESFEYDDLSRFPEKYQNKYLYFTGEVIQKTDDILRVNITKGEYDFWEDTVYVILKDENARILEDDIVKMWGVSDGNISYTAVLGQKIIIPGITVYAVEVIKKEEEPIIYQVGEAIDMEDRILTVHQVLDDYDFTSQNQFIVPEEGNKYFLIEVSITNNGSESLSCWHGQFKLKDKNNYEYKNDVTFKEPSFGIGDLLPTRTKRGFITYEIPRNISDLELVYSSWSKQVIIKL